jgi:hypothetical protein
MAHGTIQAPLALPHLGGGTLLQAPSQCRQQAEESGVETVLWVVGVLYLLIGAAQTSRNISRGKMGTAGPLVTFIFGTFFWPFLDRY